MSVQVEIHNLPDGGMVVDYCISIKVMDLNGDQCVYHRYTDGMNDHEAYGRVRSMTDCLQAQIVGAYVVSSGEDEEGGMEDETSD